MNYIAELTQAVTKLQVQVATVTAERDDKERLLMNEARAHADTLEALDTAKAYEKLYVANLEALRADLATVTAEKVNLGRALQTEAEAHAETRKALEFNIKAYNTEHASLVAATETAEAVKQAQEADRQRVMKRNESLRAELAKSEARAKELEHENARLRRIMIHNGLTTFVNEAC